MSNKELIFLSIGNFKNRHIFNERKYTRNTKQFKNIKEFRESLEFSLPQQLWHNDILYQMKLIQDEMTLSSQVKKSLNMNQSIRHLKGNSGM